MAFTYPLALHFPSCARSELSFVVERFARVMKQRARAPMVFKESMAELIFDKLSGNWLNTVELVDDNLDVESIFASDRWLRFNFEFQLGNGWYFAELYTFPIVSSSGEFAGLQLNFDGRAYASIFDFQPRAYGGFDENAKRDFLAVCMLATELLQADAFILLPDEGELVNISTNEILARLQEIRPVSENGRPGLITGLRGELTSVDHIREIWQLAADDSRLITTTSNYLILDLLQPFVDE